MNDDSKIKSQVSNKKKNISTPERPILESFKQIISSDEQIFRKNGVAIVQYAFKCAKNENYEEIKYLVNRLIRGLGASKDTSRTGYFATLIALLSAVPTVNIEEFIMSVKRELQISRSNGRKENGDIYFGQVLSCGALIYSNLFSKVTSEQQQELLEMLFTARSQRQYLTMISSTFLVDLVQKFNEDEFESLAWPLIQSNCLKTWNEQSVDNLFVLMKAAEKFPAIYNLEEVKACFKGSGPLNRKNINSLCEILFKNLNETSAKHPICLLISKEFANSSTFDFVKIFNAQLIKANRLKLLLILNILMNVLNNLSSFVNIPKVLPNKLVITVLNYAKSYESKNDKEFHLVKIQFFDTLSKELISKNADDNTKLEIIKKLLFDAGVLTFEQTVKTKILHHLIQSLNFDGVENLGKLFKEVILDESQCDENENSSRPWNTAEKVYVCNLLGKLLCHSKTQGKVDWKADYMKLFIDLSMCKSNVNNKVSAELKGIFFKTLDQKFLKLEEMCDLLTQLTQHVKPKILSKNVVLQLTDEDITILKKMYKTTSKVASDNNEKYITVFNILFYQMGFQFFKNKDLALSSVNELLSCYKRVVNKQIEEKGETEEPNWIEVVIDLFLNMLSHNTHLFRNIIISVFPYLREYLTPSCIQQIVTTFDPTYNVNPLSNENEESSNSDSEDSNVEDDAKNTNENEESEDEEYDNDMEVEQNETVTDKLRLAVQQALRNDDVKTDDESIDLDEMSDKEGERLNYEIGKAFKEFRSNLGSNKKKASKEDITVMNFRIRVLDLISIYLSHQPSLVSCLEIMSSLLNTLKYAVYDKNQEPLLLVVQKCLRKLTSLKKFDSLDVTNEILSNFLSDVVDTAEQSALKNEQMRNYIADCCNFIIRCSQMLYTENKLQQPSNLDDDAIIKKICELTSRYLNEKNFLLPYIILNNCLQNFWCGNLFIIPSLLKSFHDQNPTKQLQIINLLKAFYLNRRNQYDADCWKQHLGKQEKKFCKKLKRKIDGYLENPDENKTYADEKFLIGLFDFLRALVLHPLRNDCINWGSLRDKLGEFRSKINIGKVTKKKYKDLYAALNAPDIITTHYETANSVTEDDTVIDDEPRSNKNSDKKRKSIFCVTKEAKQIRLEKDVSFHELPTDVDDNSDN